MIMRTALIILVILVTSACSTLRPHVNQYASEGFLGYRSCQGSAITSNAITYANYLRCKYTDVLNDRITWDRGSGFLVAGALAMTGYRGIRGGHEAQVAALTTGSGALYAANQLLVNDRVSAVYAAGIAAVNCVSTKYSQAGVRAITDFTGSSLNFRLYTANQNLHTLIANYSQTENYCDSDRELAQFRAERARQLLSRIDRAYTPFLLADANFREELNAVDAKVKMEVDKLLPDIDAIYQTINTAIPDDDSSGRQQQEQGEDQQAQQTEINAANSARTQKQGGSRTLQSTNKAVNQSATNHNCATTELGTSLSRAEFKAEEETVLSLVRLLDTYASKMSASGSNTCGLSSTRLMTVADGRTSEFTVALAKGKMTIPIFNSSSQLSATTSDPNLTATFSHNSTTGAAELHIDVSALKLTGTYTVTVLDHLTNKLKTLTIAVV